MSSSDYLLCVNDASKDIFDPTKVGQAESRKLTTPTSSIAGPWSTTWLSIRRSSVSTTAAWFLATEQCEGIERLATSVATAARLLSAEEVKGVEGLLASTSIVVVRWSSTIATTTVVATATIVGRSPTAASSRGSCSRGEYRTLGSSVTVRETLSPEVVFVLISLLKMGVRLFFVVLICLLFLSPT